jgi:hypothetical protein
MHVGKSFLSRLANRKGDRHPSALIKGAGNIVFAFVGVDNSLT